MSERRQTMEQVMKHMKTVGFCPSTLVDVGVAYGTPGFYGIFDKVRYLLVDPIEEYSSIMEDICSKFPGEWHLVAAGPQNGEIEMNVHPDLSGSSIYKESEGRHVDGIPRTVPMRRLDSLLAAGGFSGPMIVKLDVQGAELEVLEGASLVLSDVEAILMEVSMFSFYVGSPQFAEVVCKMAEMGYVVYDIFAGCNRPLDNALGQVDVCFVREGGFFRQTHDYATLKQREEITPRRMGHLNPKK